MRAPEPLHIVAIRWPEIGAGDPLDDLLCELADLRDGDVAVVTSKVVAKAEGRTVVADRADVVEAETRRVVARRGAMVIAETRHGFVMAAAGVDASNTEPGTAVPLPLDPDRSARALRAAVQEKRGLNVAIVVSDTAGRAWRTGQTDFAVGCAGLPPLVELHGTLDTHGNELLVTAPALADEVAAAADLVKGKTTGCPVAIVRGLGGHVLPPGEHGPGACALVRSGADDLFGLGVREAVAEALLRDDADLLARFPRRSPSDAHPFARLTCGDEGVRLSLTDDGCPAPEASPTWTLRVSVATEARPETLVAAGRLLERADALAASYGLSHHDHDLQADQDARLLSYRCWWTG